MSSAAGVDSGNLGVLRRLLPNGPKDYRNVTRANAEHSLSTLCEAIIPHLVVKQDAELRTLKLADTSCLNRLPAACADFDEELSRAGIKDNIAGEDGLSALRVVAVHMQRRPPTNEDVEAEEDAGVAAEGTARALALLLKAHLLVELVRSGPDDFKRRYNEARGRGRSQIAEPGVFIHNLAVTGKDVNLDDNLLAIVGGYLAVDFLILRVRRDASELNNAANTSIDRVRVTADQQAFESVAQLRSERISFDERRPVIPLLEVVVAGVCVYRWLKVKAEALQMPTSQVTDWQAADELQIWLPEPANCRAPLYRLRYLPYRSGRDEYGDVMWQVVRRGHTQLVLQKMVVGRHGELMPHPSFSEVPVAEFVPGSDGKRARSLQHGASDVEMELNQGPAQRLDHEARADVPGWNTPLPAPHQAAIQEPRQVHYEPQLGQHVGPQQLQPHELEGQAQQQMLPPQPLQQQIPLPPLQQIPSQQILPVIGEPAAALQSAGLSAAWRIQNCPHVGRLAEDEAGRAPAHMSAKDTAKALVKSAEKVQIATHSPPEIRVALVSCPGTGKTTIINKMTAQLMASRGKLRRVLPQHLQGDLSPYQRPTTVIDFLRLCGVDTGNGGGGNVAAASASDHVAETPLRQFSATLTPLPVKQEDEADPRFMEGNEFDYFDLQKHSVSADVQERLNQSWDLQPCVDQVGDKYNWCKPRVDDVQYGCFMPNGKDDHCTDRVQHVHMQVADRLDAAAFRFCLQQPSRAAVNKQIHQFRRYIKGDIKFSELDSATYDNVPYMCGLDPSEEEDEELLTAATIPDEELFPVEDAASSSTDKTGRSGPWEEREQARQRLLARLYPLQRYKPWLGMAVEFRLYTDDTQAASEWAEFFSTRFILGRENAAFALSDGAAIHVPSEMLSVHIMDMPGVEEDKHGSNALQASEVEDGLRALALQRVEGGHTVVVLPTIGRETSDHVVINKLSEAQLLQEAVRRPEDFTLVPLINLKPESNVVLGMMMSARTAPAFVKSYNSMKFPGRYCKSLKDALMEAAQDMENRNIGAPDCMRAALDAGQLVQMFALDVGGSLIEAKPFRAESDVAKFLCSAFVNFLHDTQQRVTEEGLRTARKSMWKELGCMVIEGVGLAARLRGPRGARPLTGADNTSQAADEEDDATSLVPSQKNFPKVKKALRDTLDLQASLVVGTANWVNEVKQQPGNPDISQVPLSSDAISAWVEHDRALRCLLNSCTTDLAKAQLKRTAFGKVYNASGDRVLGKDLNNADLNKTNLPDLLLSEFKRGGEGMLSNMLEQLVSTIIDKDIKLVQTQIHGTRANIESNIALKQDSEVQLLLDVFDESIAEVFSRKKVYVVGQLGTEEFQRMLSKCWRMAINNSEARAAAVKIYKETLGRKREHRLDRVCTDLLEEWKESLMPGGNDSGPIAAMVKDLAGRLLKLYSRERAKVIREALKATASNTVITLGPIPCMALHVIRAGLGAAGITAGARRTASIMSEELLKELQGALQAAKENKKARMEALYVAYGRIDPLDLVCNASNDGGLREWVTRMADGDQPKPATQLQTTQQQQQTQQQMTQQQQTTQQQMTQQQQTTQQELLAKQNSGGTRKRPRTSPAE